MVRWWLVHSTNQKNENYFPKRNRWIITQPIVTESLEIMSCVRRANAVDVKIFDDYKYRREQQIKAYGRCEALLTLIEVAHKTLNLDLKRIEHWTNLICEVEEYIQKWMRSDKKRYLTKENVEKWFGNESQTYQKMIDCI